MNTSPVSTKSTFAATPTPVTILHALVPVADFSRGGTVGEPLEIDQSAATISRPSLRRGHTTRERRRSEREAQVADGAGAFPSASSNDCPSLDIRTLPVPPVWRGSVPVA